MRVEKSRVYPGQCGGTRKRGFWRLLPHPLVCASRKRHCAATGEDAGVLLPWKNEDQERARESGRLGRPWVSCRGLNTFVTVLGPKLAAHLGGIAGGKGGSGRAEDSDAEPSARDFLHCDELPGFQAASGLDGPRSRPLSVVTPGSQMSHTCAPWHHKKRGWRGRVEDCVSEPRAPF